MKPKPSKHFLFIKPQVVIWFCICIKVEEKRWILKMIAEHKWQLVLTYMTEKEKRLPIRI